LPYGSAGAMATDAVPAAIAAIVGAEPVPELDPGPPGATSPAAPLVGRRRRRPSTTVGADEAIA